jgi:spermidine/putrescine transport system ATP-binding protein
VAAGIRPEKIRLGAGEENSLAGHVKEQAYIGVSTQYIVDTAHGPITVYVQNTDTRSGLHKPGDQVTLSWSPEATFVVDPEKEKESTE